MISLRRTLLAVGLGLVLLVNYGIHRVRPELAAQADLRAQTADLDQAPLSAGGAGLGRDLRLVEGQIARLEERLSHARPLASDRQAAEVDLRLAALAGHVGLRVSDTAPLPVRPGPARPGESSRPHQAWRLHGTFSELQAFVRGLDELPWRVVLAKLEVERLLSGELEIRCELAL